MSERKDYLTLHQLPLVMEMNGDINRFMTMNKYHKRTHFAKFGSGHVVQLF